MEFPSSGTSHAPRTIADRRRMAAIVAAVGVLSIMAAVAPPSAGAAGGDDAEVERRPAVHLCGVADVASQRSPDTQVERPVARTVIADLPVTDFAVHGDVLVVFTGTQVRRYSMDGTLLGTVDVATSPQTAFIVLTDGSTIVQTGPTSVGRFDQAGTRLWHRDLGHNMTGLFEVPGSGAVGVAQSARPATVLDTTAGATVGSSPVTGRTFTAGRDGTLLSMDGRYMRRYAEDGALLATVGDRLTANDPQPSASPLHFYQPGAAVDIEDLTVIADGGRGLYAVDDLGLIVGRLPESGIVGADGKPILMHQRPAIARHGSELLMSVGPKFKGTQGIVAIDTDTVLARFRSGALAEPFLGFGAGLRTPAQGNYFRPGADVQVSASFDPWWEPLADRLALRYEIRDHRQAIAGTAVDSRTIDLGAAADLGDIPLQVPSGQPGAYQVDARLLYDGRVISATCLTYTVAPPAATLDFATLPPGAGYGGPGAARGIALADAFGTGLHRTEVDWNKLLPAGADGPLDFASTDAWLLPAAEEARSRGLPMHVQVASGTPLEKELVASGRWATALNELVRRYAAPIDSWEAWNEPNITYGGAAAYTDRVLRPLHAAVRTNDPDGLVAGPSTVGVDVGYLRSFADAGGLDLVDIVAVHPYTGHNRSFEEHGVPRQVEKVQALLAEHGASDRPIWFTEQSWWSDGPRNIWAQADYSARSMLWQEALGVERWYYFLPEGGWGNSGVSFSAIEHVGGTDYVKPAALALMHTSAALSGRSFLGWLETDVPQSYVARFGPRAPGESELMAIWTDDLRVPALITAPSGATATDVFGRAVSLANGQLELSGSPVYIESPAGTSPTITGTAPFGASLVATAGATASSARGSGPASEAVDGINDTQGGGQVTAGSAWVSAEDDPEPWIEAPLTAPATVDRVLVSTHSLGSVQSGNRNWQVKGRDASGVWHLLASVQDQFHDRGTLVRFAPRAIDAVRVTVSAVNYGGYASGMRPTWWPIAGSDGAQRFPHYGPAVIYELAAYEAADDIVVADPEQPKPNDPSSPPPPTSGGSDTPETGSPVAPPTAEDSDLAQPPEDPDLAQPPVRASTSDTDSRQAPLRALNQDFHGSTPTSNPSSDSSTISTPAGRETMPSVSSPASMRGSRHWSTAATARPLGRSADADGREHWMRPIRLGMWPAIVISLFYGGVLRPSSRRRGRRPT